MDTQERRRRTAEDAARGLDQLDRSVRQDEEASALDLGLVLQDVLVRDADDSGLLAKKVR